MDFNSYTKDNQLLNYPERFGKDISKNLGIFKTAFGESSDLVIRGFSCCGCDFGIVYMENMINKNDLNKQFIEKILMQDKLPREPADRFEYIELCVSSAPEQIRCEKVEDAFNFLMGGNALFFSDGFPIILCIGVQGFPSKAINQPTAEVAERGSQEGFNEVIRNNIAMIRRRMKTPLLRFEKLKVGTYTSTDVALCYIEGKVSERILNNVRKKIKNIKIDAVLESGYIQPFLEKNVFSLFSEVGTCERPDTVCGKILEGRIAIIVDGTPFCLIVPHLFSENFQNFDDYALNPIFVSFIRILKYLSFFLSILLPGLYVAIGEYNPEIFPTAIFYKVVNAKMTTPFSLIWEALIIYTIYEIMREAGLRLPKAVGHAVSIVGALVIGDAAVTAGLIGAPMIIIVAITALASYVVPKLYYASAILRFAFIVVGGFAGVFGVILALWTIIIIICSQNSFGIPFSSPISPFDFRSMRDTFVRLSWKTLSKKNIKIQNLKGAERNDNA